MESGMTAYLENKVLDDLLGITGFSPPATFYVALLTTAPSADDMTGAVEVSGGSYVRKSVASGTAQWNTASGGLVDNKLVQEFVQATADWGAIVAVALYDAATAGNALWYGDLSASKTINNGDVFRFAAGALDITQE